MDWKNYNDESEELLEVELTPEDEELKEEVFEDEYSGWVALTGLTFERKGKPRVRIEKGEDVPPQILKDDLNAFVWLKGRRKAIAKK
jgi:hypothetical protein